MLAPASPPPSIRRAIEKTVRGETIARAVRCFLPSLAAVATIGALGLVLGDLPPFLVSIIAGLTWLVAAALLWRRAGQFHPMHDLEAKRALEAQTGLSELAPLSSSNDRVATGDPALWAWHQRKLIEAQDQLSKPVKPKWTRQDGLLIGLIVVGFTACLLRPQAAARALWFDLSPLAGDGPLAIEVWAEPPAYTNQPTVRMSLDAAAISLPEGSTIMARLDGARGAPRLRVGGQTIKMARGPTGSWAGQTRLKRSSAVSINRFGERAQWNVTAIPDRPPVLRSSEPITFDQRGRLNLAFSAQDDYGVTGVFVRVTPLKMPEGLKATRLPDWPVPIEGPIDSPASNSPSSDETTGDTGARQVFVDVTQHALAGLEVDVQIVVKDGLGQETLSKPSRIMLPQRAWKSNVAKALAEQRLMILREGRPWRQMPPQRATLYDPEADAPIRLDLSEPLMGAPPGIAKAAQFIEALENALKVTGLSPSGLMALSVAKSQLANARDVKTAHAIAPLLWQLAVSADRDGASPAQQRLAEAREALEEALKNGASDEEIKQLTQELREAVRERVQELAEQAQQQGGQSGDVQGENGQEISGGDLDSMLEDLERKSTSGAREEALNQLDQLDQLMQGLQVNPNGSGSSGSGPLDEAMREQRDISDETTERGGQDSPQNPNDLADRQDNLAERLESSQPPPQSQDGEDNGSEQSGQEQAAHSQASEAMREAAKRLREGDFAGAEEAQSRAEQALRQAAEARQAGQGNASGEDPLGRPSRRPDDGRSTKVPDELEKRRARDVREELRRRQADPNREKQERDYIDRLLQDRN